VPHNLVELLQRIWALLGLWFLSYEFLFTTARTLCHYVCILVSSSNIQLYLCTHDSPRFSQHEKITFSVLPCQLSNVLILEFHRQLWSSPVNMYPFQPLCLCMLSTKLFFGWISLSWLLRSFNHEFILPSYAHNILKKKALVGVCICIARAFGNLELTNMHTHGRFQKTTLSFSWMVMLLFHKQRCRDGT
jgi:hypothetical protein